MKRKSGISLVMLVITIVILAILVATTVTGTALATNNARKVTFAQDLLTLEDNIQTNININGKLPLYDTELSVNDVQNLVGSKIFQTLKAEMLQNKEILEPIAPIVNPADPDSEVSVFKILDMTKLGIANVSRGAKKDNNEKDQFIVSMKTGKIYYLEGVKIGGKLYHSLTDKLLQTTGLEQSTDKTDEYTTADPSEGMQVYKSTNEYTNELVLTIKTKDIDSNIYGYKITIGDREKDIKLTDGKYILSADSDFNSLELLNQSKAKITKKHFIGGRILSEATIDISNLDVMPPSLEATDVVLSRVGETPKVTINSRDDKSGIDSYYIDYVLKYRDGKVYKPIETALKGYYTEPIGVGSDTEIKRYLIKYGKKSYTNSFALESNDYIFRVVVKDKAGNISQYVTKEYKQTVPQGFYYVGGTLETGIVISDSQADENKGDSHEVASRLQGNQFVFIPVNNISDLNMKVNNIIGVPSPAAVNTPFLYKTKEEIVRAGGFYIARYEASATKEYGKLSQKGSLPLEYETWNNAFNICKNLYITNDDIVTLLPYGEMWDRVLDYISEDGTETILGGSWGNTKTFANNASKKTTGYSEAWKKKNIYDISGNLPEWTQEEIVSNHSHYKVRRGGSFTDTSNNFGVSTRFATNETQASGFRPAFYMKNSIEITKPYIPSGFYYVGGTMETGIVISDDSADENKGTSKAAASKLKGNQFVWVPISNPTDLYDEPKSQYSKIYDFNIYKYGALLNNVTLLNNVEPILVKDDTNNATFKNALGEVLPYRMAQKIREEFEVVMASIEKYRGFYVARYETSKNNTVKMDQLPKIDINWYDAYKLSKEFYKDKRGVKSTLIYGTQWDAIVKWMVHTPMYDKITENSNEFGNYSGVNATGDTSYSYDVSGHSETFAQNNIYDMAGNVGEWTQESGEDHKYELTCRVIRGGNGNDNGQNNTVASRKSLDPKKTDRITGYRMVLILD